MLVYQVLKSLQNHRLLLALFRIDDLVEQLILAVLKLLGKAVLLLWVILLFFFFLLSFELSLLLYAKFWPFFSLKGLFGLWLFLFSIVFFILVVPSHLT